MTTGTPEQPSDADGKERNSPRLAWWKENWLGLAWWVVWRVLMVLAFGITTSLFRIDALRVQVVRAKRDIPAYTRITSDDLVQEQEKVLFRPPHGLVRNDQAVDRIARVDIPKRGVIRWSALLERMPVLDQPPIQPPPGGKTASVQVRPQIGGPAPVRPAWHILSVPLSSLLPPARAETVLLLGVTGGSSAPKVVKERALALDVKGNRVMVALTRDEAFRAAPYLVGDSRLFAMRRLPGRNIGKR